MSIDWHCTCPTVWHGIFPPPKCAYCEYVKPWEEGTALAAAMAAWQPRPLSEADIERIAQRVADLLRQQPVVVNVSLPEKST